MDADRRPTIEQSNDLCSRPAGTKGSQGWSTGELAEFLDLISGSSDEDSACQAAVEKAAEALETEVAAVTSEQGVIASVGISADEIPHRVLTDVATGLSEAIALPRLGRCAAYAAEIDSEPPAWLVIARSGPAPLSGEEMSMLRGLARGLAMALRLLRGLTEERELRRRSEEESRERQQAQAKYRNLVERLPAIVYQAEPGERGRWRYVSPQIESILGFSPEEWTADESLWTTQLHPEDRERVVSHENRASIDEPNPPPIDYRMLTRDGRVIWMLDEAMLEQDEEGTPVWHGVLYDITDRKGVEGELERRAAQQAAVARLGERAMKGAELEDLMETTVSIVAETERVERTCVWQFHEGSATLMMEASVGSFNEMEVLRIPVGRDSAEGATLESIRPVIVEDWGTEERFDIAPCLRDLGIRSTLSVPIEGSRRPFGVLEAHSNERARFSPQDVHFVQSAANILADAIERREADEAMRHRALHDPLTGLPNRLLFVDRIAHALALAQRRDSPVAVYFLDLDHFKLINDSLGHQIGDELLRAIAPRLRTRLRAGDTVARFGGDEFAILVEDVYDADEARVIAARLREAFEDPFTISGVEQFVTASVGIALSKGSDDDPETLIRDADAAMYRAKDRGRARSELFDEAMRANAVERLELERQLRRALENDELVLHYQPIVAVSSGEIAGVEALVRWQHPERGLTEPAAFIPVAEESGLIEPLGRWVQGRACEQTVAWQQLRPDARPIDVSVNLSARQFAHRDLPSLVEETLSSTGLDAGHLHLEITESLLVEDSGLAMESLRSLDEIGVQLVLDDFGTGYSSLAYVNKFPLHTLKIDRSFVEGLGTGQERSAIVRAIIGMARALSMSVVAEGVENEPQLQELRRLGCDYAQGFYFSQPVPAPEITGMLMRTAVRLPA